MQLFHVSALLAFAQHEVDSEELSVVGVRSSVKFKKFRIDTVHFGKQRICLSDEILVWRIKFFAVFLCAPMQSEVFGKIQSPIFGNPRAVSFVIQRGA